MGNVTTLVIGTFSADHKVPYGKRRHGHDWHVAVSFIPAGHKDTSQEKLDSVLGTLDHNFLDDLVPDPTNEGLAEWLGNHLDGAVRVRVWRYDRGRLFGASWSR